MSQELPKNNNNKSEEVDLLVFFNLIGNAFSKVYSFFERIVLTVYRVVISILQHLFDNAKWYAIGLVLSFVLGYVLDNSKDKVYGANMFINTNFNSSRQVYENIKNLNQQAAIDKDYKSIASQLKITEEEASQINGFFIEPDLDENTQVEMYIKYKSELDSVARAQSTFNDYVEGLNNYSFNNHKIGVSSKNKNIYKVLKNNFVNSIRQNPYLDTLKLANLNNIKARIKDINRQVSVLDSLKNSYLAIRIKESNKSVGNTGGNGTNLYMGDSQPNELLIDESQITAQLYALAQQKTALEKEFLLNQNVINVVSDFPASGYDMSKWTDYKKFTFPIITFIIIFITIILIKLKRFLNTQKR